MSVSITDRAIRQITLAALVVAILCIPARADQGGDPIGACCLPDGSCIDVTETQCQTQGGAYQGDGAMCDGANCPAFGACCIPFDICEVTTIQVCIEMGGVLWAPGQDCETFPCPPLGACCRPDGTCQITGQRFCENTFDGTYQGDGVKCQDISCTRPCPADLSGDGEVGILDLLVLLSNWGLCPNSPAPCPADLNGDSAVGILDLLELLANWGPCP
ncbi:MAG: hypothetical protein O6933_08125 [Planctomycetota bacterium]|nr:hypothetical protein [Planctomycetota bacterium]